MPVNRRTSPRGAALWGALCALSLWLSACGFHLRGPVQLPEAMKHTYLQGGNRYGEFMTDLRQFLTGSGVTLVDSPKQATAILRILRRGDDRRVLSVGPDGRPREYELYSTVEFDVVGAKGQSMVADQQVDVRRDFYFSEADVLGKANEEALLRREMHRDLARMLMLRLQARAR